MARPGTKADLIKLANENYAKLKQLMCELIDKKLDTNFDFSDDEKKKEAHWKRDKNLRDVAVHLYEWHILLLDWVKANTADIEKSFLPEPYNWRTYGNMNFEIKKRHQKTSRKDALNMLDRSHEEVMQLIEAFGDEELFSKGVYKWTGGSTLGSYFVSASSSHYDWAIKKLKAHKNKMRPRFARD